MGMADEVNRIEGELRVDKDTRFAIVASRFNSFIVDHLQKGALDMLVRHGASACNIDVIHVPGAYELPLAIKRVLDSSRYDAVVALGCVIRGGTPHFDQVVNACNMGIARLAIEQDVPIGFGVLTVETIEQAIERAGTKAGNKGAEAAVAAMEMVNVLRKIGK